MASSRSRPAARLIVGLAVATVATACALQPEVAAIDPGIELPTGPGRDVMLRACVDCHDLGGLNLFADFFSRAQWHELVTTMVTHGAELSASEVELVADYLGENF